ncbi:MAG: hypothetical protein QOI64_463 [Solirubrobacteraceae bacterium]|nr:hypothetical protein [Solirubrobacteraceae bacterium]
MCGSRWLSNRHFTSPIVLGRHSSMLSSSQLEAYARNVRSFSSPAPGRRPAPLPGSGADLRKLLPQRDHRTTRRPALTIAAQAHPVAPYVDRQTQIERLRAVHLCTDINRSAIGPRHPALLLDLPRRVAAQRHITPYLSRLPRCGPQDLHSLGHDVPNSRQNPADTGSFRHRPVKGHRLSPCETAISRGTPSGLHTREVAGSKPAAPITEPRR